MNIIITGGTGFIGYHLAIKHLELGDKVYILDNLYKNKGEKDSQLKDLLLKKDIHLLSVDMTKEIDINIISIEIDIIYHLAAINGTELFYQIPYEVAMSNMLITINLLKFLEKKKAKKLIFSSTSEVYAGGYDLGLVNIPTDENVPVVFTQPTDNRFSYGASKFMSEFLCLRFGEKFNTPVTIIRYHNIYGPRMGNKHVVPQLIKRLEQGENPLEVFGSNETRAFCYIDDAVEATKAVAVTDQINQEVVHIGNDREEITISKLASLIIKNMNISCDLIHKNSKSSSVKRRCPNIDKLVDKTDFYPKISLEQGIKKTIDWYLK